MATEQHMEGELKVDSMTSIWGCLGLSRIISA